MSDYRRAAFHKIDELLRLFPVVLITGVRQCGKTTLAKQVRKDWKYFDLERSKDKQKISQDYDFFFREYPNQIIFDEAQELPALFKELRGVVDERRSENNRFLLTGSSSRELISQASDSLAGRVAIVELGTLKASELHQKSPSTFYDAFHAPVSTETIQFLKSLREPIEKEKIKRVFLRGGYPEPSLPLLPQKAQSSNQTQSSTKLPSSNQSGDSYWSLWMENYIKTYVERDVRKLFPRLDFPKYQRFIAILSSLSGTIVNKSDLARSINTSAVTVNDYIDIAHGTYVWRNIPSFESSKSKSIIKMPKGIFRDSGLGHFLQGIQSQEDLDRYPRVGASFEAFVIEEILKGIQYTMTSGWRYAYYRTRNGAEVDLILEGPFGILPIEIKYGTTVQPRSLRSLRDFVKAHDLPLGIVINFGTEVEQLADCIVQVPVGCL